MAPSTQDGPYQKILKLPPGVTEPDHYELLGLPRFEEDTKRIRDAALERNQLLRSQQNVSYYEDVRRIEREIGAAMVCLTNPRMKEIYDKALRAEASHKKPIAPAMRETVSLADPDQETAEVPLAPARPEFTAPGFPPKSDSSSEVTKTNVFEVSGAEFVPGERPWSFASNKKSVLIAAAGGIGGLILIVILAAVFSGGGDSAKPPEETANVEPTEDSSKPAVRRLTIETVDSIGSEILFEDETGSLLDLAVSPKGDWVAALGGDGQIRVWRESQGIQKLDSRPILCLDVSQDGTQLFAGTSAGDVQMWTMETTAPKTSSRATSTGGYSSVIKTSDETLVGFNSSGRLWKSDANSSRQITMQDTPNIQPTGILAARPNTDEVAFVCRDGSIRKWETGSYAVDVLLSAGRHDPTAIEYSRDGEYLAIGTNDFRITLKNIVDANVLPPTCVGHEDLVLDMDWTTDGKILASVGADRAVRLWETESGRQLTELGGHASPVFAVAIAEDDSSIVTASRDGRVRRWTVNAVPVPAVPIMDPPTTFEPPVTQPLVLANASRLNFDDTVSALPFAPETFRSGQRGVDLSVFSSDGRLWARKTLEDTLAIHDALTGELKTLLSEVVTPSDHIAFTADGQSLLIRNDSGLSLWDTRTGTLRNRYVTPNRFSSFHSLAAAKTSPRWAAAHSSRDLFVYASTDNLAAPALRLPTRTDVDLIAISPSGRHLAAAESHGDLQTWDLGDPRGTVRYQARKNFKIQHHDTVRSLAISDTGEAVLGFDDGMVEHVHPEVGRQPPFRAHTRGLNDVLLSEDGALIITAGNDDAVHVWDASTHRQLAKLPGGGNIPGSSQTPVRVRMGHNGYALAVATLQGRLSLWSIGTSTNSAITNFQPHTPIPNPAPTTSQDPLLSLQMWDSFYAHQNRTYHVTFSHDGNYLISTGADKTVRFWETDTGDLHHAVNLPGTITWPIDRMAVSSTGLLAIEPPGVPIQLFDVATGSSRGTVQLAGQTNPLWFDFTPDGTKLMVQTAANSLQFWNVKSQSVESGSGVPGRITAISAPSNSTEYILATASSVNGIRLWNDQKQQIPLAPVGSRVNFLEFSPDGNWLAGQLDDRSIRIWNLKTRAVMAVSHAQYDNVRNLKFSADSSRLLILMDNDMLRSMPVVGASASAALKNAKPISATQFDVSPKGGMIAFLTKTRFPSVTRPFLYRVSIWGDGTKPSNFNPRGHYQTPKVTAPTAPLVVAKASPLAISATNAASIKEQHEITAHAGAVWSLDFLPDGSGFVTGGLDRMAYVFDTNTRGKLQTITGHTYRILAVAVSPDHDTIATADSTGYVQTWSRTRGSMQKRRRVHDKAVSSLLFSADGDELYSASVDKTIRRLYSSTLTERDELKEHNEPVTGLAWLAGDLCSSGRDNKIIQWNSFGKASKQIPGHGTDIEDLTSTPSRKMAFASSNKTVGLYTGGTDGDWLRLKGHTDVVRTVAFSPDETVLASTGQDLTIKLWNADTGDLIATLTGHEKTPHCLCFSPDGRWLVSGDAGGLIKMWGLSEK